jgi:hypothetical protein
MMIWKAKLNVHVIIAIIEIGDQFCGEALLWIA